MYQVNGELKRADEVAHFISILTSGVTVTDIPVELGDRNSAVFSGAALLQFHETGELDMCQVQEILAYDLIELDMTEQRCFSVRSLLTIRRIVDILSNSRPVLILVRRTEDIERNYETLLTGLKYDFITIAE